MPHHPLAFAILAWPALSLAVTDSTPAPGPASSFPHDPLTTGVLVLLTLLAAVATGIAFVRLRRRDPEPGLARAQASLIGFCILGSGGLFLYRWLLLKGGGPLEAHVDGLLLIAALFGATVMFLQARARLPGLSLFALPVLTIVLAWAICASWWTFHPFHIATVWNGLHLVSVYVGTLFFAIGAIAGGMYLVVEHRLRRKVGLVRTTPLASLEALERAIIHTSVAGFALLSLGLVTGVIIMASSGAGGRPDWWYGPKVILGAAAWGITALVMNIRHATRFRGARAAWLTIAVFVLMLATFAASNVMPGKGPRAKGQGPGAPTSQPTSGVARAGRFLATCPCSSASSKEDTGKPPRTPACPCHPLLGPWPPALGPLPPEVA